MEEKEVIREGEAFERLFANEDFKVLQEYVQSQIQLTSGLILGPDGPGTSIDGFESFRKQKGILLGLATSQSYMEDIVKQTKVIKEERRKEEEAKRARDKRQAETRT